jgi:SdrD B-like domain
MKKQIVGALLGLAAVVSGGIAFAASGSSSKPSVQVSLTSSATSVAPGGSWTYNIAYSCASPSDTCKNVVIQLPLPSLARVITPPEITGGRAAITNTGSFVRVAFTDDLLDGTSGVFTTLVGVPSCVAAASPQPSSAPATATISGSGADDETSTAPAVSIASVPDCIVTPALGCGACPPDPIDLGRSHEKTGDDVVPGGRMWWTVDAAPRADAFDVIDILPAGLVVSEVGAWGGVPTDVRCGGAWYAIDYSLTGTSLSAACAVGRSTTGTNRFPAVDAVRMHVPARESARVELWTSVPSNAAPGSTIQNCATAQTPTPEQFCATISVLPVVTIPDPQIRLVGSPETPLNGTELFWGNTVGASSSPTTQLGTSDLAYLAGVRAPSGSGADMTNPVFIVELSPDHTFDSTGTTPNFQVAYGSPARDSDIEPGDPRTQPGCLNPTFTKRVVGGRENLIWSFSNCIIAHAMGTDAELEVFFSTRLKAGVTAGTQMTATLHVGFANNPETIPFANWRCDSNPFDGDDFDGDGLTGDSLCGGGAAYYRMPTHAELTASNTVQGALDLVPTLYPQAGSTDEVGDARFSINLKNTGTVGVSSIDLVSILPFAGDNVLGGGEGSEWDMKLLSISTVQRVAADGTITAIAPADYTIGYSASRNPCRFNAAALPALYAAGAPFPADPTVNAPAGCTADPWTATAATAASWALRYLPSTPVPPGEVIRVVVDVIRANNLVAIPNGVAWNSVAFSAETVLGSRLLANQPRVGGVRIVDTAPSVGGMVWSDEDKNGLREDTEPGVENVVIDVLDSTGTVVGSTTTDVRGTYFVSDLVAGATYTVRFRGSPLAGFDATLLHVGTDPYRDNDATRVGIDLQIAGATTSARYVTGGLDLGLIDAPVYGAT